METFGLLVLTVIAGAVAYKLIPEHLTQESYYPFLSGCTIITLIIGLMLAAQGWPGFLCIIVGLSPVIAHVFNYVKPAPPPVVVPKAPPPPPPPPKVHTDTEQKIRDLVKENRK